VPLTCRYDPKEDSHCNRCWWMTNRSSYRRQCNSYCRHSSIVASFCLNQVPQTEYDYLATRPITSSDCRVHLTFQSFLLQFFTEPITHSPTASRVHTLTIRVCQMMYHFDVLQFCVISCHHLCSTDHVLYVYAHDVPFRCVPCTVSEHALAKNGYLTFHL